MILLDTSVFIDHLRNHPPALEFFDSIADRGDVLYSAITESELLAGASNADAFKREKLLHFLQRWTKVELGNPLAIMAGDIARQCRLGVPDAVIAASALANNAQLLTRNVKDFKTIDGLRVSSPY